MTTYRVTSKETGEAVYSYTADTMVEWEAFPYAQFDHTAIPDAPPEPVRPPHVYGGRTELTHEEFRNLFKPEEQWVIDAFEAQFEQMPIETDVKNRIRTGLKSYYAATFVDLKNPKVELVLGVFAGLHLISVDRIQEILNG